MATTTATAEKSKTSTKSGNTATSNANSEGKKVPAEAGAAKDLAELFEDGLKDIYWAEKALTKALPKMEKNASSEQLKSAISKHLAETETHVDRLEQCFELIGVKAKAEKCEAMAGLLEEAESLMKETEAGSVRDAAIIAAGQKVEHYEIATYGTLAAFAKVLTHKDALKLLLETLGEEKKCDEDLSALADTNLNSKAE
ncbi:MULTISPECIES: YciE/YciF ferroxidase family protein [Sphingobacterium]|jgi:ferritin-like metal-binding protein YciE|uniref:YciE/YciF ferroxidase family protein n=1 Tax=Sphingobacterium TaxID=28453 RepID=UPI00257AD7C6|nr:MULTISPECIES: ferritin-like domain-containing protein [Sphingobacterium]